MNKSVYILILGTAGLALVIAYLLLFSEPNTGPTVTTFPNTTGGVTDTDNQVPTNQYGDQEPRVTYEFANVTIAIRDPLTLPTVSSMGDELYNITDMQTYDERNFNIIFNADTQVFTVALLAEPLSESRLEAAAYMQSTFGLSAEELCLVPIDVAVPFGVNNFLSGEALGMPDCPGSFDL